MRETKFNVSTFNVRGITSEIKRWNLNKDLLRYNIDLICLQETKISDDMDIQVKESRLICFKPDCRHYGSGFIINKTWKNNIHRTWKETDRIRVIHFKTENGKTMTIINSYGPTQKLADDNQDIRCFLETSQEY